MKVFWRNVYKRLAAPWALRIDVANGPIFIANEGLLYDVEELEDEK
ncbi:hypothetical protein ACFVUU_05150 [Bacillus thuringiensis]